MDPVLSWDEAHVFCQDHKAQLVVIKDYKKQMFLTDLTEGAKGGTSHFWIGLSWQDARAQLTWVDGTPASQSWYRNWLPGHPKKEQCVQLVGIYTGQWRDWDCRAKSRFLCEMQVKDAFPGLVTKAYFRSRCYSFHFPSFREWRSWREAQAVCQESRETLATVHDEEENAFLADAFPEDGWQMWIGLRFGTAWRWQDDSSYGYSQWHPENSPSNARDQCVVLILRPEDPAQHGTWKTRPCHIQTSQEITGFICQGREDFCGPPEPVHFPLPGGMAPHATLDITFFLPGSSACSLSLTGLRAGTNASATLFWLRLESSATHVHSSVTSELGGFSVHKVFPGVPFTPGISTWSFVTYPDGFATFFNQQEHFRMSESKGSPFAVLRALQIGGARVVNASLVRFPGGYGMKVERAIRRYLGNFTLSLWLRSSSAGDSETCVVSYAQKWKGPEFALFLLSPSGLDFHLKGATMFREIRGNLLDGSWHHLAVSVSSAPGLPPVQVFVDGEPWEPSSAGAGSRFWKKGLSLGGTLSVGQLERDGRGTSFYVGDLSEVNLWDQALSWTSVKQLAASRTQWKYPGNVVSWPQLVATKTAQLQLNTLSEAPEAAFVWFGYLQLRGKPSVLCADPEHAQVSVAPARARCLRGALWGLQPNGRLRRVGDPPSCLRVAPDGVSLLTGSSCSSDARNSFRLLPDQRLQHLHSGLCLFQDMRSARLSLGACTPQALHFVLDWAPGLEVPERHVPFVALEAALEWRQALAFCQRFRGGSLVTLNSPQDLVWLQEELQVSVWSGLHSGGGERWSWADGTPFNQVLRQFMSSWGSHRMKVCMLALPSGSLKAEPCHRPHQWICQIPRQTGESRALTLLGCCVVFAYRRFPLCPAIPPSPAPSKALPKGWATSPPNASGKKDAHPEGGNWVPFEGKRQGGLGLPHSRPSKHHFDLCQEAQQGSPGHRRWLPGVTRAGSLSGRSTPAVPITAPPPPTPPRMLPHLGLWGSVCRRAVETVTNILSGLRCPVWNATASSRLGETQGVPWLVWLEPPAYEASPHLSFVFLCPDVELLSFQEKLLVSLQGPTPHQRHRSWPEALATCYLQEERCMGLLSLNGAHYTVGGTVLVDSPGSGALLYLKAGLLRIPVPEALLPCLSTRVYNPLTGRCDGPLRCARRFSPSCAHGLVHARCPEQPGWWFWGGHCYYVEEHTAKDWEGARAACQAYGKDTDLLRIGSTKEKGWVAAMVQGGSWIGLNDADQDGIWTWAGGQVANLSSPWLASVPLPVGGCLEIGGSAGPDGTASPCSQRKAWVCEGPWASWSPCPAERGWHHWNGSCYFWDPGSVARWPEAVRACRRFRETELLSLMSPQEKDWIRRNFGGSFWTGLNDRKEESVFRWTTQELLTKEMSQYLRDDLADGGLKDCVWFDAGAGLLRDAPCEEERPFVCKSSGATDWFEERPGHGVAGLEKAPQLFPSAESLEQAKRECLRERPICLAVLQTGSGFYLISSLEGMAASRADSTLFVQTFCAEGFAGPDCRAVSSHLPRPACDCTGRFQTTAEKESSLSDLDPEELALITMIQFKVSHALNLTAEDERDRGKASRIIYDAKYPDLTQSGQSAHGSVTFGTMNPRGFTVSKVEGTAPVSLYPPLPSSALPARCQRLPGALRLFFGASGLCGAPAALRAGGPAAQRHRPPAGFQPHRRPPGGCPEDPGALRRLSLSANALVSVHRQALAGLGQLEELDLSGNELSLLPPETLLPVPNLRVLNLAHNRLLGLHFVGALPQLQVLSVQGNALTSLKPDFFQNLPSLQRLRLEGNPWACSCGIQTLFQWLADNASKVPEVDSVYCKRPAALAHYPIATLGNDSFARCLEPWLHPWDYAFFLLIGPSTFLASIGLCILAGLLAAARARVMATTYVRPGALARRAERHVLGSRRRVP
ncbi:hypothetical protein JRQ81_008568 [Phrynocephalus forsythii]|uniref:C-type lectin domain-containing protein n=1 Tax=Phrynocephalus forsythii TaxID=171643 RepID=A0A9Q0XAG4_9SAUR|nr:hypothetical protein JRQ81_008568 [Phrynocephalus forsythii]